MEKIITFILAFFASFSSFASELSPHVFRVSKDGVESLLIGTVHVGVDLRELGQFDLVKSKIKEADAIIVEWAFSKAEVNQFLKDPTTAFLKNPDLAGIPGTHSNLPRKAIEQIISFGVPRVLAEAMSENHCKIVLAAPYLFPKPMSLDFKILQLAYQNEKEIISLDSLDTIREKPTACSITDWMSRYTEKDLNDIAAEYLRTGYFRGDAKNESEDSDVVRRNSIWINKLSASLARSSLVAVGVGHLYGKDGLIQLLRNRGFSIEAVN